MGLEGNKVDGVLKIFIWKSQPESTFDKIRFGEEESSYLAGLLTDIFSGGEKTICSQAKRHQGCHAVKRNKV